MRAIGIDLGTYNSVAAYVRGPELFILRSRYGHTYQGVVFPSFVQYDATGAVPYEYGEKARQAMANVPEQVVWGVKRLIGRTTLQTEADRQRYRYVCEDRNGQVVIRVGNTERTPTQVSADILAWIRNDASNRDINLELDGEPATHAIITHPAYFDTFQIEETQKAAATAGFVEVHTLTEPSAAALAYGTEIGANECVLTIDWGAGTLDLVLSNLVPRGDTARLAQSDSPYGDIQLGGIDMDDLLLRAVVERYALEQFARLLDGEQGEPNVESSLVEARFQIERSKIRLSDRPRDRIDLFYDMRTVEVQLARSMADIPDGEERDWIALDEVLDPILSRAREHILHYVTRQGLEPNDVDRVLLIGGPMHMPCVRQMIRSIFANNQNVVAQLDQIEAEGFPVSPMEAVARGAALVAAKKWAGGHQFPASDIDLGRDRLGRDYGIMLSREPGLLGFGVQQGEVLLRRDKEPPVSAKLGPLSTTGKPGDPVIISLFTCRDDCGENIYECQGNFCFFPAFDVNSRCLFEVELSAEESRVVRLRAYDLRAQGELNIVLEARTGQSISAPKPFGTKPDDDGSETGREDIDFRADIANIPRELVETARRRGVALVRLVDRRTKQGHMPLEVQSAYDSLRRALTRLPEGDASYEVWAEAQHQCEELKAALLRHQLAEPHELQIL